MLFAGIIIYFSAETAVSFFTNDKEVSRCAKKLLVATNVFILSNFKATISFSAVSNKLPISNPN